MHNFFYKGAFLANLLAVSLLFSDVAYAAVSLSSSVSNDRISETAMLSVSADTVSSDTVSTSDAPGESVSTDILSDDSLSSNTISFNAVSSNIVSLNQITQLKESLSALLDEHTVMALVYLTDSYQVKEEPTFDSNTVVSIPSGQLVFLTDLEITDGVVWYQVDFSYQGTPYTGYISRDFLAYSDELFINWENDYLLPYLAELQKKFPALRASSLSASASGYADIAQFPASYQGKLTTLKNSHTNWIFVPFHTGLDWNTAVTNEMVGARSLIYATAPAEWRGNWHSLKWYYATRPAVAYYMDTRNSLTESGIFQHEQLTYNASYHTVSAVQQILSNTFMSGNIPDGSNGSYALAFWDLGRLLTVSPFHLASRVYQEQGAGTSPLISGTYPGYVGYYNHFNVGASGSSATEVIVSGLSYAKNHGWNSRRLSLAGGASTIGNNYIKKGQDTLYLQKFDVESSYNGLYYHQYMQNIQAPTTEGQKIRTAYSNSGSLNSTFVFKIPVYNNMPGVSYSINKTTSTLARGGSDQLIIKQDGVAINPSSVAWSSSAPGIVSVQSDGTITAVDKGTAVISATVDGSILRCNVTVTVPLTSIALSSSSGLFEIGDTKTLTVSYTPFDTTDDTTVYWSSQDTSIASVELLPLSSTDAAGTNTVRITAKKPGTTKIYASVGKYSAFYNVTVMVPLQSLTLEPSSISLYQGTSKKLTASYLPVNTTNDKTIIWTSDHDAIATVENGTITGVSAGTALITATMKSISKEGVVSTLSDTCTVTVQACHLTYHDLSGNTISENDLSYGATLGSLPTMTVSENQVFVGWFTQPEGQGEKYTTASKIYTNLSLYPYYMETNHGFFAEPVGDQTYLGTAIKPAVRVYNGATLLTLGKDYYLSYKNNVRINDAGNAKTAPSITVTGLHNYSGSQVLTFKIIQKNVNDADILAEDLLKAYTGKAQKPAPVLWYGTKKLIDKIDYTCSYPNIEEGAYQLPGTYPIVITGKGGYTGTKTLLLTITSRTLIGMTTLQTVGRQTYTGLPIEPTLRMKKGTYLLQAGTDYEVSYLHNTAAGIATMTITGIGNYIGSRTISFQIVGTPISRARIAGIVPLTYDGGSSYTQTGYTVTLGTETLIESTDYVVSYANHLKTGTATIIFTGINGYAGTIKKTFKINAYPLDANPDGRLVNASSNIIAEYQKGGAKPGVLLRLGDTALVEGVDYTLSYKNNTIVNDGSDTRKRPTILIKGKGNYTGTLTQYFQITTSSFDADSITMSASEVLYKNRYNAYQSAPILYDARNGKLLKKGTDYSKTIVYSYEDGSPIPANQVIPAGTVIRVSVTGSGYYAAETLSTTYRVIGTSIAAAKIKIPTQTVSGGYLCPGYDSITVTVNQTQLTGGVDYIITGYDNNLSKGTASVYLRGIGNYGGVKTGKFSILQQKIRWF